MKNLKDCRLDYRIVIDKTGKQYKVKRGQEYLNLMMKLQRQNKL